MESFESLFMRSYVKEDGSRPSLNPQTTLLHTNALLSWALLLTICTGSQVKAVTRKYELTQVLNLNLEVSLGHDFRSISAIGCI